MKKTLILAALCLGMVLVAVGYSDSQYRTAIGKVAPALGVRRADSLLTLDQMRGDYVILNFWSSTDAASRTAANRYTAWLRATDRKNVKLLSVNFDESQGLFRQIVKLDSLRDAEQFYASGDTAKAIIDNYGLKEGYGTLLISPQGRIVAHNPSDAELNLLVR